MSAIRCYRLHFQAPFHVDSYGTANYEVSESMFHSDTLSAALMATWALMEPTGAAERAKNPPFLISSAFPWFQESYFLPRPIFSRAVIMQEGQLCHHQRIKHIRWLSVPLWRAVVAGSALLDSVENIHLMQETLALSREGAIDHWPEALWQEEINTRLVMDRMSNQGVDGMLFDFGRIHFHPQGGLYFLAKIGEKDLADFHAVLSLLGDQGLGADRSVGNGWFRWSEGPALPLAEAKDGQPVISLSLLNPAQEDRRTGWLQNADYDLIERGGWLGKGAIRRQILRFFTEGSRFPFPMQGRTVNVLPDYDHPVFRDGRGFCVAAA